MTTFLTAAQTSKLNI